MLIDFNEIKSMTIPGMNGGTGEMACRMFNNDDYKSLLGYIQAEDLGIKEVYGDDNKSAAMLADIEAFGASIK